jgi:hypothetical protein
MTTYDPVLARALLSRTPAVVLAQLEGLSSEWLDASEGPGTWSPREVAHHLADLEHDAWLPRVRTILEHGSGRALSAVERERFRVRYVGVPLHVVLAEFATVREENLRALDRLAIDEAWLRAVGQHTEFGEVRLAELLSTWVVHDLTHLAQISRALAAQYRDEVGPWIRILSVLRAPTGDAVRAQSERTLPLEVRDGRGGGRTAP